MFNRIKNLGSRIKNKITETGSKIRKRLENKMLKL